MNIKMLLLCILTEFLMGCAGEAAMESAATVSAIMLNDYRKGFENYVQAENNTLSATEARLNELAKDEQFIGGHVAVRTTAWKTVKNEAALNLYNALTAVPSENILATSPELKTLQPVEGPLPLTVDTKQFDAVVKTLNTLAKKPDFMDRLSFLKEYGSAVSSAYKASMDEAAKKAKNNATAVQTQKTN